MVKELFPIALALDIWGNSFKNAKPLFLCSNQAVVEVIHKQSCKDKSIMKLIRKLVLAAVKFNVVFWAKHIAGKYNVIAYQLSRFQFQKARSVAPWFCQEQTAIPDPFSVI